MSHRSALILSIALTLVLVLGIFAGRDRLFEAAADAGPSTTTSTVPPGDAVSVSKQPADSTVPRVIEIPLSGEQGSNLQGHSDSQQSRGRDDYQREQYSDDEYQGEAND